MPRIIRKKSTGEVKNDFQSNPLPGTLTENAVRQGWDRNDLEEIEVTKEEYGAIKTQYYKDHPIVRSTIVKDTKTTLRTKLANLGLLTNEIKLILNEELEE